MTQKEKYDIIRRCPLFAGYEDGELSSALMFFGAEEEHYAKGDVVLRMDEPVTRFALVVSGCVQVLSDDMEGSRVICIEKTEHIEAEETAALPQDEGEADGE